MLDLAAVSTSADEALSTPFAAQGADKLERAGLSGRVFFDESSGEFWLPDDQGEWRGRKEKTFGTYLKYLGFCPVVRTKEVQEKISEVDHVLAHISLNCSVQYAGPLSGFSKGLINNNGQRMLVTREAHILEPTPGEWPILEVLLNQLFGHGSPDQENDGPNQLPYFLGWWKHALECLNNKYSDKRILAMALAGEAGCGKSLIKELIALSLGGRECKPYDYMIGKDNFNKDLLGAELWSMDDEQGGDTTKTARLNFGASLKKVVADKLYKIRGICADGVTLEMFRALLICLNREPERLKVLPQLDDDIADKISVLLAHKHPMPMLTGTPADKQAFWDVLTEELPHFVYYLLHEYTIAQEDYGRFGMKHFHHPDLCSDLFAVSHEREFWVQVQRVLKNEHFTSDDEVDIAGDGWYWCGGAEDLFELMSSDSSPLSRNEINHLPWSNQIGKNLTKIGKEFPERITKKKVAGLQKWFISREGRCVTEAVAIERGRVRAGSGQA